MSEFANISNLTPGSRWQGQTGQVEIVTVDEDDWVTFQYVDRDPDRRFGLLASSFRRVYQTPAEESTNG